MNSDLLDKDAVKFDSLAFAIAGLRDGLGPMLGVFLIQQTDFSPIQISAIMAAPGVSSLIAQLPSGILYDRLQRPYVLLTLGALLLALSSFWIGTKPPFYFAVVSQVLTGLGSSLLSVGLPAATLSFVGNSVLSGRLARNEICSKIGTLAMLSLVGYSAQKFGIRCMFYVIYLSSSFVTLSCGLNSLRRAFQITDRQKAVSSEQSAQTKSFFAAVSGENFKRYRAAYFSLLAVAFIYQFANASMYMVFEQSWVRKQPNGGIGLISLSLQLTQVIIVISGLLVGRFLPSHAPQNFIRIGFALIYLRTLIYLAGWGVPTLFVAQFLDGIIAAILIIVPISCIAKLDKENFNVLSSLFGVIISAAASCSTFFAGAILQRYGFQSTYGVFLATAFFGLVLCSILPPPAVSPSKIQ